MPGSFTIHKNERTACQAAQPSRRSWDLSLRECFLKPLANGAWRPRPYPRHCWGGPPGASAKRWAWAAVFCATGTFANQRRDGSTAPHVLLRKHLAANPLRCAEWGMGKRSQHLHWPCPLATPYPRLPRSRGGVPGPGEWWPARRTALSAV